MKRIVSRLLTTALFIGLTVTGFANHNEISTANFIAKADTACCDSIDSVLIDPVGPVIVMCDSEAVTLSVPYDSCYNYLWFRDGSPIFQIGLENVITTTVSGIYYVVVSNNCYSVTSNAVTVIINVPISYTFYQTNVSCYGMCNGSVTISPYGGTAPYSILWNSGSTSFSRTGLCAGTYTFVITDSLGCIDSGTVFITQPAALVVGGYCTCGATTCLMTAQPSGGTAPYSYLWSNGQTTQSVTVSNRLKSITVTVTDAHGCTGTKSFSPGQCLSKSAGIDDTEEQRIHVYPNPVSDFISVEFAEIPTNAVALSVLDMTGRVMIEVNGLSPDRNTYYINTENIPAGVYFVRIQSESGMWVNKIIKE